MNKEIEHLLLSENYEDNKLGIILLYKEEENKEIITNQLWDLIEKLEGGEMEENGRLSISPETPCWKAYHTYFKLNGKNFAVLKTLEDFYNE